jgi:hypothetical protein
VARLPGLRSNRYGPRRPASARSLSAFRAGRAAGARALRTGLLLTDGCDFESLRGRDDFAAAVAASFPGREWLGAVAFRGPWLAREAGRVTPP